jgi:NAD(P)H-hydrate epimerase
MTEVEDMIKLVTVEQMKDLERAANAGGHSYEAMMERAGRAVAEAIQQRMAVQATSIVVLVGPGNNGGDGLVAARYLAQAGASVLCYLWKPRAEDDPNLQRLGKHDVGWLLSDADKDGRQLRAHLDKADVIVDALLGTGVDRPLQGKVRDILDTARRLIRDRRALQSTSWQSLVLPEPHAKSACDRPCPIPFVVAVDAPSGINCDTGEADPAALPADLTITFAAVKRGQLRVPACIVLGELLVADIGIDPALGAQVQTEVATTSGVTDLLPARPLDAHKGTFGKAMVVAGSVNYTGAAYLAAAAAGRVGAGLVTLALPAQIHPVLATKLTEATFLLLPHSMGVLEPAATKVLISHLEGYQAMLLGPGLSRERETVEFVHRLLGVKADSPTRRIGFQAHTETTSERVTLPPLVIDADALNALSEAEQWWVSLPRNSVLTPHPGEMGRLMGANATIVNEDRIAAATSRAAEWHQVIVLKGAFTVVAAPDGRTTVIPFANPILATAGTGDVLAGSIAGLLAQGLAPYEAAICGAYLHGAAGEILSEGYGRSGAMAGDLLHALPQAMDRIKDSP